MWIYSMGTMGIPHMRLETGLARKGRSGGWGRLFLPNFQESECGFVVWEPWAFDTCDASQVSHEKAEIGGGDFSAQLSDTIILSMDFNGA